jgi:hypothetical protein
VELECAFRRGSNEDRPRLRLVHGLSLLWTIQPADWRARRQPQFFSPQQPKFPRNVCEPNSAIHPVENDLAWNTSPKCTTPTFSLHLNLRHKNDDTKKTIFRPKSADLIYFIKSRLGRASSESGRVSYASKVEVVSKHWRLRDGPLRVDGTVVDVIEAPNWSLEYALRTQ